MYLMRASFAFVLSLFLLSFATAATKKFEKTFTVKPGDTLKLTTDVGDISVVAGSGNELSIVADMKGSMDDLEDVVITAEQTGNTVEVVAKARDSKLWSWGFDDLDIRYTIRVPEKQELKLYTSGGDVSVTGTTGRLGAATSGGDIVISRVTGDVKAGTSGGDVVADNVTGNIDAGTSGGDVRLSDIKGSVDAGTSGGDVILSKVEGAVRAGTSGGNINVTLIGANKGIAAETSGGDITIAVAPDTRANIDASTSGGSVTCNLPITIMGTMEDDAIRGTLNGGGEVIHAETSGGDVVIKGAE